MKKNKDKENIIIKKKTYYIFEVIEALILGFTISFFLSTMFLVYIGKVMIPIDISIIKYVMTSLFFYLFFGVFSICIFLFDLGKTILIQKNNW